MSTTEGVCSKCGTHYHGRALSNPLNQSCLRCGGTLEIRNEEGPSSALSTLDSAESHIDVAVEQEVWENMCDKRILFLFSHN
jgi:hypothetical protein